MLGLLFNLFLVLFLVFLNGFFVAAEFAMVKIRSSRISQLVAEGNSRARVAQRITNNLDAYLSACQLGITLASWYPLRSDILILQLPLAWSALAGQLPLAVPVFVLECITEKGNRDWWSTDYGKLIFINGVNRQAVGVLINAH